MSRELRIIGKVGGGALSEVLSAEEHAEGVVLRKVALKRLLPEFEHDEEVLRRFVDEARILARLHVPGVVRLLGLERVEGRLCQVLEWVEGLDLDDLCRKTGGPLPEHVALHVAAEVSSALSGIHGARTAEGRALEVVHRDLSPWNVRVSRAGQVFLLDFGLAVFDDRAERTRVGKLRGTPEYLSPEQARGEPVDARSDLFSLSCLLHFMLTQRSPLEGAEAQREFYTSGTLSLDASLPRDITALLVRGLAFDRSARPRTAQAMREQLEALLAVRGAMPSAEAWLVQRLPAEPVAQHPLERWFGVGGETSERTNGTAPILGDQPDAEMTAETLEFEPTIGSATHLAETRMSSPTAVSQTWRQASPTSLAAVKPADQRPEHPAQPWSAPGRLAGLLLGVAVGALVIVVSLMLGGPEASAPRADASGDASAPPRPLVQVDTQEPDAKLEVEAELEAGTKLDPETSPTPVTRQPPRSVSKARTPKEPREPQPKTEPTTTTPHPERTPENTEVLLNELSAAIRRAAPRLAPHQLKSHEATYFRLRTAYSEGGEAASTSVAVGVAEALMKLRADLDKAPRTPEAMR